MGLGYEFDFYEIRHAVFFVFHHTAEQKIVDDVDG